MSFEGPAQAYDEFMGRHSRPLAQLFAGFTGITRGLTVLDVGSGPGALTETLAEIVGPEHVAAAEPSPTFAAACAARIPRADVREVPAERLPWTDGAFDAALCQLVVNFMEDPAAGVLEMRRVVRSGGIVSACIWDTSGGMEMLQTFWDAALSLDPSAPAEGARARFGSPEDLRDLWTDSGLDKLTTDTLDVDCTYGDFDDFWQPFTAGVGPAGGYCASLEPAARDVLREECRRRLGDPPGPFHLSARSWAIRGTSS